MESADEKAQALSPDIETMEPAEPKLTDETQEVQSDHTPSPWRRALRIGTPVVTFVLGIVVAASAQFAGDWLTDLRRGEGTAPTADRVGCETDGRLAVVGEQNIRVSLSKEGENCWQTSLDGVLPGDTFDVLVEFRNNTGEQVDNATLQAHLPDGFELVANSSTVGNANVPDGVEVSDGILSPGLNVGSYGDGGNAWLVFSTRVDEGYQVSCGLATNGIFARLPSAPPPQDDWVGAIVVTNRRC